MEEHKGDLKGKSREYSTRGEIRGFEKEQDQAAKRRRESWAKSKHNRKV